VKEMLRLVSGEKGKPRDWERFRNLFLPTAQFTVLNHNDSLPQPVETVNLEEFIKLMHDPYYDSGYLEYEIGKVVNQYNGMANVFQSYYGKDSENAGERASTATSCFILTTGGGLPILSGQGTPTESGYQKNI
jgi:hypothetical protein